MTQIESPKKEDQSQSQSQSQDHQKKKQINETIINNKQEEGAADEDENVLKFMDSLDSYLCLVDSLSSTLRQGWFDFAAARYSMGASRVNCVLLDLKEHSASTSLEVTKDEVPQFTLCKWSSCSATDANEMKDAVNGLQQESSSILQRHKDTSQVSEAEKESSQVGGPSAMTDDQVQKERSKSLAVFGKLVSPKLRAAQLSFETALETLVEIANMRASMLSAFDKVQEHLAGSKN